MSAKTKEVKAADLKTGDRIVAKQGGAVYTVVGVHAGMGGPRYPYLTLSRDGKKFEHDTAFDSLSATYTVQVPPPVVVCRECQEEYEADENDNGECEDCRRHETCPECEGNGTTDEWSDDDGLEDCPECGGDGVV